MKISRRTFLAKSTAIAAGASGVTAAAASAADGPAEPSDPARQFLLHPIGRVETAGKDVRIRIFDPYVDGLLGLDGWSHIVVLYWFHRNDSPERRRVLRVHPKGDPRNPLTGVFACRSPVRPNLIALTVCKVVSVEGPVVTVEEIDALEGTPVLDIKPLIPPDFTAKDLRMPGWARSDGGSKKEE